MNNKREAQINRAAQDIKDLILNIEAIKDEEQQSYNQLIRKFPGSTNTENSANAINCLVDALEMMDEAWVNLKLAIGKERKIIQAPSKERKQA